MKEDAPANIKLILVTDDVFHPLISLLKSEQFANALSPIGEVFYSENKNQYKIAMITGAPSFNTGVIKTIISDNEKFNVDHYYYRGDNYSNPLKKSLFNY